MTSTTSAHTDPTPPSVDPRRLEVVGRFIDGLVARDFDAVAGTVTDDVVFRALLPRRVLDLEGPDATRDAFVGWFGTAERWEIVEAVVGEVGDLLHLRWRIRLTKPELGDGTFVVEQQMYAESAAEGRLSRVSLLCSGFKAEPW
jgi:ketosteroid isomerase-like protein